jgi:peptidoglycan/LPS O-acetylase OafA/YrhL
MFLTSEARPATTRGQVLAEKWRCSWLAARRFIDRLLSGLSRETSSGGFIPEMDGLRFIETCMVVLAHLHLYLIAKSHFYEHGAGNQDWLGRTVLVGSHAIEMFFVISAFMLALPFAAHRLKGAPAVDLRKYYLRRLTRLEPPYIVSLFLLMFLGFLFSRHSVSGLGPHLAASLFYLHNLIYGAPSTVLCVAWSLEIEVQFYMLVPVLTLLFAIRNSGLRRLLIVLSAVLAIAAQARLRQLDPRFALSIAGNLQFFLVGFLLADIFLLEWKTPAPRAACWDAVSLLGWPALLISLQSETQSRWLFPALILVVYCAAFRGRWTSKLLSSRWITTIGGMCYSIYLIHYAVISAVGRFTKRFGEGLPNPLYLSLQFAIVGVAIVFVCGGYFRILERPCMRRDWPQRLWQRLNAFRRVRVKVKIRLPIKPHARTVVGRTLDSESHRTEAQSLAKSM